MAIDTSQDQTSNQTLIITDATNQKASWGQIDHANLLNVGGNSHLHIDTFIASQNQASGLCPLDGNSKIPLLNIPAIALVTVSDRDNLTNIQEGDVCIVTSDLTTNNNGSYIYTGSNTWVRMSMYIQPAHLSDLSDLNLNILDDNNLLKYDTNSSKWINCQYSHTNLSDIGLNSHTTIDTFIASNNQATGLCLLDLNSKLSLSNIPTISHTTLSDFGLNVHTFIDNFISSKDQSSGIAGLDSNTKLKIAEFPNFNNSVIYYVDCNYTLGYNDGSISKPYTTVTGALTNISSPTSNSHPSITNRYIIHVSGGNYEESIIVPGSCHITFI